MEDNKDVKQMLDKAFAQEPPVFGAVAQAMPTLGDIHNDSGVHIRSAHETRRSAREMATHALRRVRLSLHFTKTNILAAMEYRMSFILQVVGMFVNDAAFTVLWYIFFQSFPTVNGWAWQDTAILTATTTMSFGLAFVFARGGTDLAVTVRQGELDYYLAFPADVLWHVSVSKTRIDAFGDLLFGIVMFALFTKVTLASAFAFCFAAICGACVMWSFCVITQSLAFFTANIEDAARDIFELLLTFSFYPQNLYTGGIRVVTIVLIPAFFTATVPHDLIVHFRWELMALLGGAAALMVTIAVIFFRYGLKRYESGNLMTVRV
jgi:ABC-2 type transport system permease protein